MFPRPGPTPPRPPGTSPRPPVPARLIRLAASRRGRRHCHEGPLVVLFLPLSAASMFSALARDGRIPPPPVHSRLARPTHWCAGRSEFLSKFVPANGVSLSTPDHPRRASRCTAPVGGAGSARCGLGLGCVPTPVGERAGPACASLDYRCRELKIASRDRVLSFFRRIARRSGRRRQAATSCRPCVGISAMARASCFPRNTIPPRAPVCDRLKVRRLPCHHDRHQLIAISSTTIASPRWSARPLVWRPGIRKSQQDIR